MGGTGTVPHCAVLSSFVATMGKVSRAVARGASFRKVPQPFKINKINDFNFCCKYEYDVDVARKVYFQ